MSMDTLCLPQEADEIAKGGAGTGCGSDMVPEGPVLKVARPIIGGCRTCVIEPLKFIIHGDVENHCHAEGPDQVKGTSCNNPVGGRAAFREEDMRAKEQAKQYHCDY